MRVEGIIEYDNGTADVSVHLDEEELQLIIEEGFVSFLNKYVEYDKQMKKVPSILRKQ